jgi:hypothetical protein
MAATTKADAVAARYRKEAGDPVGTPFVDDVLLLEFLRDAVARYSEHRPIWTRATITVLADTADYAVDAEARLVTSLWDTTDTSVDPFPVDFETVQYSGLKIRLAGAIPTAGRALTYYFSKNHTKPADISSATTLTVDDADIQVLIDWMMIRTLKARYVSAIAATGGASKWVMGGRSEEISSGMVAGQRDAIDAAVKDWIAQLATPSTLYGAAVPALRRFGAPPNLAGAYQLQGEFGWTGQVPERRKSGG